MNRPQPSATLSSSSAASDVYKRQTNEHAPQHTSAHPKPTQTEHRKARRVHRRQRETVQRHALLDTMTPEQRYRHYELKQQQEAQQAARVMRAQEDGLAVAIELSFQQRTDQRELRSTCQQCAMVYSCMRRSEAPCGVRFCSVRGSVQAGLQQAGAMHWKGVSVCAQSAAETFESRPLVFLSPDAEQPLLAVRKISCVG
eukprot:TRINITY_DN14784_c0_g1_i1.p1 TRINITY_DN14784_c0_g1~~TRINITY_DN14784_c0_g1_i1.p1  ORF type:complete len:199 (-),score=35.16 TRINITY_DN14784_c0_g1_i1:438-1034(-)